MSWPSGFSIRHRPDLDQEDWFAPDVGSRPSVAGSERFERPTVGRIELRSQTSSEATEARQALQRQLDDWECERVGDALLVFAELVSNAVRHAGGATVISVLHGARVLRFEVHDDSHAVPGVRPSDDEIGGFGLRIVSQITQSWGWKQTADGKMVWCDVPCCPDQPP
jgi:anti-sigma regulatory factor (Ser/Thr protein kinase)